MSASVASSISHACTNNFSIFEIFFDLPHPANSSDPVPARIIEPRPTEHRILQRRDVSELFEPSNISKITRFAFPGHDDRIHANELRRKQEKTNGITKKKTSGILNKHDVYFYSFNPDHFTFSIKLKKGLSLTGHVRHYLPAHPDSPARYDVGRRCPRAMAILTLAPGGERFYSSVLKSIEAMNMHESATKFLHDKNNDRLRKFLFSLQHEYEQICKEYEQIKTSYLERFATQSRTDTDSFTSFMFERKKFVTLTVTGIEHGENSPLVSVDKIQFILPESLQPDYNGLYTAEDISSPMIPLMRCIGASNVIRLLSALLCERRIIMLSRCPTRLSASIRGAVSMLAQGLLTWQHLFIPILPPHLIKYVTIKTPYLIGLLNYQIENVDRIPGVGRVLCIDLDLNTMTTFSVLDPSIWIPDLLYRKKRSKVLLSCCELLAQDLDDVLKADRRMWAEAKEKEIQSDKESKKNLLGFAVRVTSGASTFSRSKLKSLSYLSSSFTRSIGNNISFRSESSATTDSNDDFHRDETFKRLELDCCENEKAEEAVRVALTTFFLFIIGDMGMCLSETRSGKLWLDRKKYLRCKVVQGIVEESNLFSVLAIFSRTLLFQVFVKSRIHDLELPDIERKSASQKSLFAMCESFIRLNEVDSSISNIRNVVQEHSLQCPQRDIANNCASVRAKALSLTSNQAFEGNALKALASLIDSSHEVNGALGHVMGIVWIRMKETRAHLWKHPLLSLYILRNLLLHGPITVIAEANDGIAQIRELRSYFHNKNSVNVHEIRHASSELHEFLINRSYLFSERRQLACKRLKICNMESGPRWVDYLLRRLPFTSQFEAMHTLVCPKGMTPSSPYDDSENGVSETDQPVSVTLESEEYESTASSIPDEPSPTSKTTKNTTVSSKFQSPGENNTDLPHTVNSLDKNENPYIEEDDETKGQESEEVDEENDDIFDDEENPKKQNEIFKLVEMFNSTLDEKVNYEQPVKS